MTEQLKRYFISQRIYSKDLKITEHPDGDWIKASDLSKIKADAVRERERRDIEQQIKALEDFVRPFSTEASAYLREEVGHKLRQLRAQLERGEV